MSLRPTLILTRSMALISMTAALAGCVAESAKEARCACFKADGSPTGSCDFAPLPSGGAGAQGPAVFKFLPTPLAPARDLSTAINYSTIRATRGCDG